MNFLKENWLGIAIIILFAAGCIVAIRMGYINKVKQVLLYLVTEAERIYGGKTGEIKFAWVAEKIYAMLPPIVKMFISTRTIEFLINWGVDEMKKYLTENQQAKIYVQEGKG